MSDIFIRQEFRPDLRRPSIGELLPAVPVRQAGLAGYSIPCWCKGCGSDNSEGEKTKEIVIGKSDDKGARAPVKDRSAALFDDSVECESPTGSVYWTFFA